MRESRWLLEVVIFERYPATLSGSSICVEASAVNPIMALSGVRISCEMLLRNVVFAWLERSASARAASSASCCFFSSAMSASIFWKPAMMFPVPSSGIYFYWK